LQTSQQILELLIEIGKMKDLFIISKIFPVRAWIQGDSTEKKILCLLCLCLTELEEGPKHGIFQEVLAFLLFKVEKHPK